jgi:hypothetical protein
VAVLFTVPRAVRGPLTVTLPSTSVPQGFTRVRLTVDRFAWPAGTAVLQMVLEGSFDNGATWPLRITANADGGSTPYKGNPDPPSGFAFGMDDPTNTQRRVRGSIILTVPLDCGATIEAS